ncbi:MAG: ribonuclease H-like domain-containing protein [Nitrospinota bacterium]|nr:ribonuclease H-like domain-containing protein [Nitrospinota bacterium]
MAEQFDLFADSDPKDEEKQGVTDKGPRILYFDLETQKGADEVGGWANSHLMRLATGVIWDSWENRFLSFLENEADKLVEKLRSADLVVGFNVIGFDYAVLQPYASTDLQEIKTFDMLMDVHRRLGFRLSLNHLAQHTLNASKSADGLASLQWFKEGKMDLIVEYCIKDVEITRDLFLFGQKNGNVLYQNRDTKVQQLTVDWTMDSILGKPE